MTRDVYTATITVVDPSVGRAIEPNGEIAAQDALLATAQTDSAAAKAAADAIDYTTFATDLATLVADGASPTQAHVTAVDNDWTTLKALIDAAVSAADTSDTAVQAVSLTAAAATVAADVTLLVNLAAVATKNALRKAVAAIMLQATNNASGLT